MNRTNHKTIPLEERFWNKVNKTEGCWIWTAAKSTFRNHSYGQIVINHRKVLAHRVSWELRNGPIPDGLLVLHKCDNPSCVNPDHLFLGTQKDNMRDCGEKGRLGVQKYPELYREVIARNRRPTLGEKQHCAKLNNNKVVEIRHLIRSGEYTYNAIAKEYEVDPAVIQGIAKGKLWKHVPDIDSEAAWNRGCR